MAVATAAAPVTPVPGTNGSTEGEKAKRKAKPQLSIVINDAWRAAAEDFVRQQGLDVTLNVWAGQELARIIGHPLDVPKTKVKLTVDQKAAKKADDAKVKALLAEIGAKMSKADTIAALQAMLAGK